MADAGFDFLEWQWWLGGSPQPTDLDFETSVLWTQALYGPDIHHPGGGCAEKGDEAEAEARAAGIRSRDGDAVDPELRPSARLARFQDLVRAA